MTDDLSNQDEFEIENVTMSVRVKNKKTREIQEYTLVNGTAKVFVCSQTKTEDGTHVTMHVLLEKGKEKG